MNSLLTAISGQFAKAIALGTLFPVIILAVLNIIFVAPLLPQTAFLADKLQLIAVGDEKWGAVAFLFVVLVITALLYHLNIPITKLYEGYSWMDSIIGRWAIRRKQAKLKKLQSFLAAAVAMQSEWKPADPNDPLAADVGTEATDLAQILNSLWPYDVSDVLPTRLGNGICCFELYPMQAYGMDAIVLWPRLVAASCG